MVGAGYRIVVVGDGWRIVQRHPGGRLVGQTWTNTREAHPRLRVHGLSHKPLLFLVHPACHA